MNLKKKTKVMLFLLSIIAITVISAILAYLTDKEVRQNEFTIGSIDIKLEETLWDALPDIDSSGVPDAAEAMGPGDTIAKDPKVINQGKNDAYVYLKVEVPKAEIKVEGGALERQELFTYTVHGDNWILMPDLTVEDEDLNKITYIYYYKNGTEDYLRAGTTSETLFDNVTLKDITNFNGLSLEQQIVVKAYAIQMGEELSVKANPWISKFEEEKTGAPVMQGAKVLNDLSGGPLGVGDDLIVGIEISDEVYGAADGTTPVTESTAPAGTGAIGDGDDFNLAFAGVETKTANIEKNQNLAVTSRANTKVITILKYKHTIESGEVGEFKIKSFTGGNLYSKTGKKIKINTVPTFAQEDKVTIEAPAYTAYIIGEEVKLKTDNNEKYYVIENSDENKETVKVITKYCIDTESGATYLKQNASYTGSGSSNKGIIFASDGSKYWNTGEADINSKWQTGKGGPIYYAREYAKSILGAAYDESNSTNYDNLGKIMTFAESYNLINNSYTKVLYGESGNLVYWLASGYSGKANVVCLVDGPDSIITVSNYYNNDLGVRPVFNISKSLISK